MLDITKHTQQLRTLLEKAEEVRDANTDYSNAKAILAAREAFEARIVQHVAFRVTQVLDAITGE
jgi:hypothetical protein